MMRCAGALGACVLLACPAMAAGPRVLVRWEFERPGEAEGWRPNHRHLADLRVADGALQARAVDWDPFLHSPLFKIPARHSQWIETRIRASHGGRAEVFWSGTLKTKYGGFSPGKSTPFHLIGDGEWHVYRIHPGWEPEGTIIHVRLDFPPASGKAGDAVAVDYVRILQPPPRPPVTDPRWEFRRDARGWTLAQADVAPPVPRDGALVLEGGAAPPRLVSPPLDFDAVQRFFVTLRLAADRGETATLGFATDAAPGLHTHTFPIRADGEPHYVVVDLSAHRAWRGRVRLLTLEPTDAPGARGVLHAVEVSPTPAAPAEVAVARFALAEGLPRARQPLTLVVVVRNTGGAVAKNVQATVSLPAGLTLRGPVERRLDDLWYGESRSLEWPVTAAEPLRGTARVTVAADGLGPVSATSAVHIGPSLGLPQADYVPEPRPARTPYQVGAYYFPGWPTWARWRCIADYPEREPLLGWYDESSPEVADWQIKWAVEHGLSFLAVDWYWCRGGRHLEHWLHEAYFRARYRRLLKFCLLWANHNPPGSSSHEDLLAVTDYWLTHYFKRPEYLTVEGKPVVIIFSTHRLTQDLGTERVAAAFAAMRQRCREAGLPGLYLVACTRDHRATLERLKAQGYDAASGYNYPRLGAAGKLHAPYADLLPAYRRLWHQAADLRILKEIPVLSGGWDSRPWHGQKALVRTGRTPALFEQHCRDAKAFLDRRDAEMPPPLRMCLIEAWNEWGEGSYIAPHAEFGFGYLEAVRRVFAPDPPPPQAITPRDVGLGPYDLPRPEAGGTTATAWDFARAADRAQWHLAAQIQPQADATALAGTSTGRDPIVQGPPVRIPAAQRPWLCVEMQADRPERPQLFWSTTTAPVSQTHSVRFDLPGDGQYHTCWVPLSRVPAWAGLVTGLRFDPANAPGVRVRIRSLRFATRRDN